MRKLSALLSICLGVPPQQRNGLYCSNHVISPRCRALAAKPKRGSMVDSYQTVGVQCTGCGTKLFRYKKKNGMKSNLVKCYVERIVEDYENLLESDSKPLEYHCPNCNARFARSATIHGLPALKLVGGKVRMTKK